MFLYDRTGFRCTCYKRTDEYLSGNSSFKSLEWWKEIIQWSERDGWAHLYLYDDQGNLKNRITKGPWHVEEILKVDDKARVIYFTANGMNAKEHPYYEHLYRVNLDGSGLKLLTKGDYFHRVEVDDDARLWWIIIRV